MALNSKYRRRFRPSQQVLLKPEPFSLVSLCNHAVLLRLRVILSIARWITRLFTDETNPTCSYYHCYFSVEKWLVKLKGNVVWYAWALNQKGLLISYMNKENLLVR